MRIKLETQPFKSHTAYVTTKGKFVIVNEKGHGVFGQPSLDEAIRMARIHLGSLIAA